MKTTEEKASLMLCIEKLVDEWFKYIDNCGNECAYTDAIIERIQATTKEL